MKTKGKNKRLTMKKIFITLAAALIIAVPLRIVQMFTIIDDGNTGFYKTVNWTVYTLYAVLVIFGILLFAFSRKTHDMTASRAVIRKDKTLGIASFVMAAGIGYDVIFMLTSFIRSCMGYSSILEISFLKYFFANGLFAIFLEGICGIAACIYLIMFGLSYTDGKTTFGEYKLLALMPLFWSMFRMVYRFMTKISFTKVSDLLFELFMLAFMMLFFMSFARVSSGMAAKGEMRKIVSFGLPAVMLAALIGVSRFVVTIGGRSELLAANFGFSLADLAFPFFAIVYIDFQTKYGRPESEDDLIETDETKETKKNATDDNFLGQ